MIDHNDTKYFIHVHVIENHNSFLIWKGGIHVHVIKNHNSFIIWKGGIILHGTKFQAKVHCIQFLALPDCSILSNNSSIPIMAATSNKKTTNFIRPDIDCTEHRDWTLLVQWVPFPLLGQTSAQILDASNELAKIYSTPNARIAITTPRIPIPHSLSSGRDHLFGFSYSVEGGWSVDVTVLVLSGDGLCSSCLYCIQSPIIS